MTERHRREFVVGLPEGMHIRPLGILTETANKFSCEIMIAHGELRLSAKATPMELMMLNAPQGSTVVIETEGDDGEEAMRVIVELFDTDFGLTQETD